MNAGQTTIKVGTRIKITGLTGEDKDLNGLTGTATHPFAFGETKADWLGILLDAGNRSTPWGGQVNVKVSEIEIIEAQEDEL